MQCYNKHPSAESLEIFSLRLYILFYMLHECESTKKWNLIFSNRPMTLNNGLYSQFVVLFTQNHIEMSMLGKIVL
jgi:hypothetical protein